MEEFKLMNFKKQYGFNIPTLRHFSTHESETIKYSICSIYKESSIESVLSRFNNTLSYVGEIDYENENFILKDLFASLGINIPKEILINWNKFEDIDVISFDMFDKYFFDIWHPIADDIEIFDENLKWIISIRHDGIISIGYV